jgi:hypothetical protein
MTDDEAKEAILRGIANSEANKGKETVDRRVSRLLKEAKLELTREEMGCIIGIVAEENQNAYCQGYSRGYENGHSKGKAQR